MMKRPLREGFARGSFTYKSGKTVPTVKDNKGRTAFRDETRPNVIHLVCDGWPEPEGEE